MPEYGEDRELPANDTWEELDKMGIEHNYGTTDITSSIASLIYSKKSGKDKCHNNLPFLPFSPTTQNPFFTMFRTQDHNQIPLSKTMPRSAAEQAMC